jgi:hypothetical protein
MVKSVFRCLHFLKVTSIYWFHAYRYISAQCGPPSVPSICAVDPPNCSAIRDVRHLEKRILEACDDISPDILIRVIPHALRFTKGGKGLMSHPENQFQ